MVLLHSIGEREAITTEAGLYSDCPEQRQPRHPSHLRCQGQGQLPLGLQLLLHSMEA